MKIRYRLGFILVFFCFGIISSKLFASALDPSLELGIRYMNIAERYHNFEKFDKALKNCENSIATLKIATAEDTENQKFLGEAYYLKANILTAKKVSDSEIIETLKLALQSAPDMPPPQNITTHPRLAALFNQAQSQTYDDQCNRALHLYADEKYCQVADILEAITHKCSDQQLAKKILEKSRNKCQGNDPPPSGKPRVGVCQVIYNDQYSHSSSRKVKGRFPDNDVLKVIATSSNQVEFVQIDNNLLEKQIDKHGLFCPFAFLIRVGRIYENPCVDILASIEKNVKELSLPETSFNDLPDSVAEKLKIIAADLGVDYLFLFYVENSSLGIDIDLMFYNADAPKKPVVRKSWNDLTRRRVTMKRIDDCASLIREYFQEMGL